MTTELFPNKWILGHETASSHTALSAKRFGERTDHVMEHPA
jgi:hypothetical protein